MPAMRRLVQLVVALVAGLGLVTWVASRIVDQQAREWFDKDVSLRSELAVSGAREALIAYWGEHASLERLLGGVTRDERIMAAAACDTDLTPRARTLDFPRALTCEAIGAHVQPAAGAAWAPWSTIAPLRGGDVYVHAIPVYDGDRALGFVVLVHDRSFVERREAKAQAFLLLAFGILALGASVVTLVVARLSWLGWSRELRRLLRGGARATRRPEFRPILADVRDLVQRMIADHDGDREGGAWTPQRLRHTLGRYLHGEKIIIIANREPYIHQRAEDTGEITVVHPASGLVTALEPVMRACSGTWIAHGSGSADRESADRHGRLRVPPGEESYVLRRVSLSPEEERGYYYGFSNEGLWPLCHIADARPSFRSEDWRQYQQVNQKFVDALCAEVDTDDPVVLVQDYHFALAPRLIRERLPRATVITFWHIPWPNAQRFGICPWRKDLLEGMLGASILGFHTQFDCNNFLECVDRFMEARIDREQNAVVQHGRSILVRPYPIALESPVRWLESAPPVAACRAKEFVAAREDEAGVLVLSQFTGAARELAEALIVNPYDIAEASDALATALAMSPAEQRERMRSMRAFVSEYNVYRWAGRMLLDAAKLRIRERIVGRLANHLPTAAGSP
jgi:trehalose 6-phosphate synthase